VTLRFRLSRHGGYWVGDAESLAEGLLAAKSGGLDVVVCDLVLPDGSGIDLIARHRERGPVKATAVGGFGRPEDVRRSTEASIAAHLTEPVEFDRLREVSHQVVSRPGAPGDS